MEGYSSDNEADYNQIIEIKRLNFFIGKNNAGKSRFLRSLFKQKQKPFIYKIKNITDLLKIYLLIENDSKHEKIKENQYYKDFVQNLDSLKELSIKSRDHRNIIQYYTYCIDLLGKIGKLQLLNNENNTNYLLSEIKLQIENAKKIGLFYEDKYIPILRGMRPVTDQKNKQPYIERAQKDYFSDADTFNSKNIITGECLYHELQIHLLGKPEQRDLIKSYEEKLSQYFFDNETITLIPYIGKDDNGHENDVVHIKIGKDEQFAIHKLGDGLQQAIILTYEALIKRGEIYAFFIEEPELHMHAGMVRQLMNFYLNETPHYYFFTTHSNHLLDMADESDQVMIQKFVKQPKEGSSNESEFKICRCDRDRDLLASLGVRPSSVYLANCTIWFEGITDRLYIIKYMEKYLDDLKQTENKNSEQIKEDLKRYSELRRFMPNYHYSFVEYSGSNLSHWSFDDNYPKTREERIEFLKQDRGQSATAVASDMLLIADGNIQKKF